MSLAISRRAFLASGIAVVGASSVPIFGRNLLAQTTPVNSVISISVDTTQTLAVVPRLAFGFNLLATRDNLRGTYGNRIANLRPTLLRWPGGSIASTLFEPPGVLTRDYQTSLWVFLRYCLSNGITPAIVVPARPGLMSLSHYRRAMRTLVRRVNAILPYRRHAVVWELGNEFYSQSDVPIAGYVRYFQIAQGIIRRLRPTANGSQDRIGVIAGPPTGAIVDWAEPLGRRLDHASYDFLIFHSYPINHLIYTLQHIDTARRYLGNKPVFISEWNHHSCWNPEWGFPGGNCESVEAFNNNTYGMSLGGAMVSHFSLMMCQNLLGAAFWAVQQNNMTSMFPNEGIARRQEPYITGKVFEWLRETEGMRVVATIQTAQPDTPACFVFANDSRMFIFIDARNTTADTFEIDVGTFEFSEYWGTRLSGANNVRDFIPEELRARAVRFGSRIRVQLRQETSYELIRVVLTR